MSPETDLLGSHSSRGLATLRERMGEQVGTG